MMEGRLVLVAVVALIMGLVIGFMLRPLISPAAPAATFAGPTLAVPAPTGARGKPYFLAHMDEARWVISECRSGSVEGGDCVNAEQAITEAEGRERFKKFMSH